MAELEGEKPRTGYEQIVDAVADLLQTASDWLRQEAESTVREKVVLPLQKLGITLAAALAAAALVILGILFVCIGLLVFLGPLLGWHVTLWGMGGTLLLGALACLVVMYRNMDKGGGADDV
ncbi:MAG: hypothetical protein C0418_02990 [Coriobacteriaceae bacterium]|nr:hypothetical protein [Coriobacteriaceae bacterium]